MNCKNCENSVIDAKFCSNCGAEIVTERLTVRRFWAKFTSQFIGWDNKFMKTLKGLLMQPHVVMTEYIDGTRKKYVPPMLFVALGIGLTMLIFNIFQEQYLEITNSASLDQAEFFKPNLNTAEDVAKYEKTYKKQLEFNQTIQKTILKHFNLYSLMLLPLYSLISFLTYKRTHRYAEHLVFNCYLQGFSFLVTIIFFALGALFNSSFYFLTSLFAFFFYTYAFAKLYKQKFWQILISILKFIGLTLLLFIILIILSGIVAAIVMDFKG